VGAIATLIAGNSAKATDLYWDTNGATANTGTTAAGNWDGTAVNWNSDATGEAAGTTTAITTTADVLHFSSGTNLTGAFTVTIPASSTQVADSLVFEDGTVTVGGTGTVDIGAGTSGISVADTHTATISALIVSSNGFIKSGTGNLILGNVNNAGLTNTIKVKAGALVSGSAASSSNSTNAQPIELGDTDPLSTAGATFSVGRNQNYNSSIIVMAGSTGVKRISGGPGLTAQQTPTILSAVSLDDNLTLGNGAAGIYLIGNNYGGVVLGGTITGSKKITVDGFNPFVDAQTYVNNLTNATQAVTVARINGGNVGAFTGNVEVARGVLNLSATGSLGADNTVAIATAGALDVQNNVTIAGLNDLTGVSGTVLAGGSARTLTLGGTGTYSFAGTVTNPLVTNGTTAVGLSLTIGNGTNATKQTLSGANSYSGITTVASLGKLTLGSATALGSNGILRTTGTGGTTVAAGGTLDLNGQSAVNEVFTLNGTGSGGGALVNGSATAASIASGVSSLSNVTAAVGLSALPTITISGGGGSGATATALGLGLTAASITVTPGTTVYSAAPAVAITGGGGTGATATAVLTAGVVTGVTITNMGTGYNDVPTVAFTGGTVTTAGDLPTATGNATNFTLSGVQITANGSGYTSAPTVVLSQGTGTITANISGIALASDTSIGGTGDITVNPPVTGGFGLTKVGTNKVTLASANSYTGATTVSEGILSLASPSLDNAAALSITTATGVLNLTHTATDIVGSLVVNGTAVGPGTYGGTGSGAATIVTYITGPGKIQVGGSGGTGYADWAGTNAGGQPANQDFDKDGVSNGVEYFMNAPAGFTANPPLTGGTVTWINGGKIPSSAYGTQFVVQISTNLVNWTVPLAGVTNTSGSVSYTLPSGAAKSFTRLVVTPE
jgi:autotransporter-associated beta strand protein